MSIKAKQVAGVTGLVFLVAAVLSAYQLATLARLSVQETAFRGEMLSKAVFQRAIQVEPLPGGDRYAALRADGGVRAILESSIGYAPDVTYAAVVDTAGVAVAHSFASQEGQVMAEQEDLEPLVSASPVRLLRAVYSDRTFEFQQPLLAGSEQFGSIRIGVSMLLVRDALRRALYASAVTVLALLAISSLVAMVLAQWMLRPIHVIQSGLTRLGRGELDVRLDLPGQEFKDLGTSFEAVSAQLSAMGRGAGTTPARKEGSDLESVMDNLEDAVGLFSPAGELIFANAAMEALVPPRVRDLVLDHPVRQIVEATLEGRRSQGPASVALQALRASGAATSVPADADDTPEWLLVSHAIQDTTGRFLGAMLVARNLGYMSRVYSTISYSRKLAALGRLMAGVAHEVKNPLNAMTIHLELLKEKIASVREPMTAPAPGGGMTVVDMDKHVRIIGDEIKRLDQVVIGFLKFTRPDELKLQPVPLPRIISDVARTVGPECERARVEVRVECADGLPFINADPGMLAQALLNLALNGCQAMPEGGTLRLSCRQASRRRVQVDVEDTGVGIPPEDLERIFDLYFTTKQKGSGIGLSMVYRIVQLHDGEVEVESTPGRGTRFRLLFPQA